MTVRSPRELADKQSEIAVPEELLADEQHRRRFERELLYGEATEALSALMTSQGISQRELAERLGISRGRVSQILSGRENLTLKTLAEVGWALGVRFEVSPFAADREGTPALADPPPPSWISPKK
jgi:antitoxin component HigA of HigAB toxin-antitoxin module